MSVLLKESLLLDFAVDFSLLDSEPSPLSNDGTTTGALQIFYCLTNHIAKELLKTLINHSLIFGSFE